jgi:hypothetical protein
MKRGADLAVRELAISEVTIAIVEHTYCAFRNGDVNSKAQCQLAYVLLDRSEPIVVQWGWCRLSWCFGKWCRGGGERRERRAGSAQRIGSVKVDLGM